MRQLKMLLLLPFLLLISGAAKNDITYYNYNPPTKFLCENGIPENFVKSPLFFFHLNNTYELNCFHGTILKFLEDEGFPKETIKKFNQVYSLLNKVNFPDNSIYILIHKPAIDPSFNISTYNEDEKTLTFEHNGLDSKSKYLTWAIGAAVVHNSKRIERVYWKIGDSRLCLNTMVNKYLE